VNETELHRLLDGIEIEGEADARRRTLALVRGAVVARERQSFPRRHMRALALATAVGVVAAVAVTPPGRAVVNSLRDSIGRERVVGRQPSAAELLRLPAAGRLLVGARSGPWIVPERGAKRLLGPYRDASWSPHGLFVVAVRKRDLLALDTRGRVRWSLPHQHRVLLPRWSPDGYRIGYFSGDTLRVTAGDGTGDHALFGPAAAVAPAWYPSAREHLLAFADSSHRVRLVDADSGHTLWRVPVDSPRTLAWTHDGRYLLSVSSSSGSTLTVIRRNGRSLGNYLIGAPGSHAVAVAPTADAYALATHDSYGQSTVVINDLRRHTTRRVFSGRGTFNTLAWSPDGNWLALGWPTADQILFVHARGRPEIRAVSNIGRQFDPASTRPRFPNLGGWCCTTNGQS
jgi:hypothetical protein